VLPRPGGGSVFLEKIRFNFGGGVVYARLFCTGLRGKYDGISVRFFGGASGRGVWGGRLLKAGSVGGAEWGFGLLHMGV